VNFGYTFIILQPRKTADVIFRNRQLAEEHSLYSPIVPLNECIRLNHIDMIEREKVRNNLAWLKKALQEDYTSSISQASLDYYINDKI